MTTFESTMATLKSLLNQVDRGEIQLPDFQRSWVWTHEDICSLIASVSLSYPIGAILLLETGDGGLPISNRHFEGVPPRGQGREPKFLILDGQQRLTALYLALRSGQPVPTQKGRGGKGGYVYYLSIKMCLDPDIDREDAVCLLPPDLQRRASTKVTELDLSTKEKEYKSGHFPLGILFDPGKYDKWDEAYTAFWLKNGEKLREFNQFKTHVADAFRNYRVPLTTLDRSTTKEAVCRVFEKVNTGGVTLTVFELVTASFAASNFKLREDWDKRSETLRQTNVLERIDGKDLIGGPDFLKAITLLVNYKKSQSLDNGKGVKCSRGAVLNLSLDEYKKHASLVEEGFKNAASLLMRERIFCGHNVPFWAAAGSSCCCMRVSG